MATHDAYASIPRAQLTYDYLHTNSTTHEFLFGALAELVDNARDAASKRIDIYSVPADAYRGKYMLCFLDDGDGMDPDEVSNVIRFGRSDKRIIDKNMIGQYGNGLKSGTMRIAKDMILFTKKDNKLSCLMISRTFHEREKINEILIPMPNWDAKSKRPLYRRHRDAEQHQTEVNIITKYSPFKTTESLFAEFAKIKSTGTLVILYNLQLMDNGQPELDVTSDPYDILMGDPYAGETYGDDKNTVVPEKKSFRAYTAVLYLDPKMKIYIQNRKVRTVRLATSLYKPVTYTFTSKRFKCRLEREEKKAEQELKLAEAKAKELEMQDREERERAEGLGTSKDAIVAERQSGVRLAQARTDVNIKRMTYENTKKALKEPQTLDFVFGINLNKRRCCGVMVYNCNRLIKMYQHVGCQTEGGVQGYGVMGIVNVPYLVLEPTHNKQDFADGKEYKALTKALGEHLDDYWKNCPIAKQGVVKFWEAYGYNSSKWRDDPSLDDRYVRKRMMELPLYVQCDKCLKWRHLDFHSRYVQNEPDEHWCCKMNPDSDCNNCQRPEKKPASISRVTLNKSRPHKTTATENNRDSRGQTTDNRSQSSREAARRQPSPPPRTIRTAERAPERPIPPATQPRSVVSQAPPSRPVVAKAPQPRAVVSQAPPSKPVAHATPSSSSRKKTQISSVKRQEKSTSSQAPAQVRQIKQEKSSQQKRQLGRLPRADSTEQKQESTMKRPHPDNNNVDHVHDKVDNAKRIKSDTAQSPAAIEPDIDTNADMDWTNEREAEASGSSKPTSTKSTGASNIIALQGSVCEAKGHDGGWHAGSIVCVKQQGDRILAKVKFQEYQQNKFDKWYDYPGANIRLEVSSESKPSSPVSLPSPQPLPSSSSIELPSTTTNESRPPSSPGVASPDNTVSSLADREEAIEDLATLSRKLLEFYAPPEFRLSKDELGSLSVQELRNFNTKEYCDKYEEDLGTWLHKVTHKAKNEERDEMSRELQQTRKELSDVTQQLTSLRGKTCTLIGMLNDSSGDNHVPENITELENTLDNYIALLQSEASQPL